MNQRANGEGSFYRRADGRWTAACYVLRPDGIRVRLTTDLYSHVMPTALREAADAMDRVFVQPN
jgi:hypothetical protein